MKRILAQFFDAHRVMALATFALVSLLATGARARLQVVTSTSDLAAVAAAIGRERTEVRALAAPTQDPHWVDARPNLALALSNAGLLIVVGAELEVGWLPALQVGSRNAAVQKGARGYLDCSELVELIERPAGKIDRSMGDIHPSGNPHYMLDPRAVERVAVGIGKRLAELDPAGRAAYLENTKRFVAELREARTRWQTKLEAVRGKPVVTFHRSLGYLASFAGLAVIDHVEPKPGIPPSPRHVASVIERAKQHGVRVLLQESYYPSSTSELIARKIGGRLVKLPAAPNFAKGQSYVAFMDEIVNQLASAL